MSKFNTAWDTRAGTYVTTDLVDKIIQADIQQSLRQVTIPVGIDNEPVTLSLVEGGSLPADLIRLFNHPVFYKLNGQTKICLDVRKFGRWNPQQSRFVIRNHTEFEWAVQRAVLNAYWVMERPETLRDVSGLAAIAYSSLISQTVAKRFALDLGDQLRIAILAAYHYYCLFDDDNDLDELALNKTMGRIAKELHVPATKVVEILKDIPPIDGVDKLCEVIKTVLGSVRLSEFDVGILTGLTVSGWIGTDSREMVAVGLEHVPTWMMIVYACLDEASFKRTTIAQILTPHAKGGADQAYVRTIDRIIHWPEVLKAVNAQVSDF